MPNTGRDVEKLLIYILLGGMLNGSLTLENNLSVSYKTKHAIFLWSSNCILYHLSQRGKNLYSHTNLYPNVHSSFIHNIKPSNSPDFPQQENGERNCRTHILWNIAQQQKGMNYCYIQQPGWISRELWKRKMFQGRKHYVTRWVESWCLKYRTLDQSSRVQSLYPLGNFANTILQNTLETQMYSSEWHSPDTRKFPGPNKSWENFQTLSIFHTEQRTTAERN